MHTIGGHATRTVCTKNTVPDHALRLEVMTLNNNNNNKQNTNRQMIRVWVEE